MGLGRRTARSGQRTVEDMQARRDELARKIHETRRMLWEMAAKGQFDSFEVQGHLNTYYMTWAKKECDKLRHLKPTSKNMQALYRARLAHYRSNIKPIIRDDGYSFCGLEDAADDARIEAGTQAVEYFRAWKYVTKAPSDFYVVSQRELRAIETLRTYDPKQADVLKRAADSFRTFAQWCLDVVHEWECDEANQRHHFGPYRRHSGYRERDSYVPMP